MIFSIRRSFYGPKNCHCSQNVTVTGVTVSGEACTSHIPHLLQRHVVLPTTDDAFDVPLQVEQFQHEGLVEGRAEDVLLAGLVVGVGDLQRDVLCLDDDLAGPVAEILALKQESRILGQWSNPASGSRKSQAEVLYGSNCTESNLFHHGQTMLVL